MTKFTAFFSTALIYGLIVFFVSCNSNSDHPKVILDFSETNTSKNIEHVKDAAFSLVSENENPVGKITFSNEAKSGIKFILNDRVVEFFDYIHFSMDVKNIGNDTALILCRINNEPWHVGAQIVAPNSTAILTNIIRRSSFSDTLNSNFPAMFGLPGGMLWGPYLSGDKLHSFTILLPESGKDVSLLIDNVRLSDKITDEESIIKRHRNGFIDKYGQYKFDAWPGRIVDDNQFTKERIKEEQDLNKYPVPASWNEFGGWEDGPTLKATSSFYTKMYNNKWWLVDPKGKLFWSHGIVGARSNTGSTAITGREHFFDTLPDRSDFSKFYTIRRNYSNSFYDNENVEFFNFEGLNLWRKYGEKWEEEYAEITHKRYKSWGMNTMGNWSDPDIYLNSKTPYTVNINTHSIPIHGVTGPWNKKFPDPFHPMFRNNLIKKFNQEKELTANDPYNIGYFIDNELYWGEEFVFGLGVMQSDKKQPAKIAAISLLKKIYTNNIKALNSAWVTNYANWESLLSDTTLIKSQQNGNDLIEISHMVANHYFSICKATLKNAAPDKLYLGCRFDFHFYPDEDTASAWVVNIAAKYCDVISCNRYTYTTADLIPLNEIDMPFIIGEFHFGALDRGVFHTGLRSATNQKQRAKLYGYYVNSAIENPYIVGTHWFIYSDQMTTGRFDGENYQIGFKNIVDTPYPEMVAVSRKTGANMYQHRAAINNFKQEN